MANNQTKLNVVGIDFLESKESLKQFLKSQDTLKDYNFDGSILSTVLDVLAYNNHYQAFYANMLANEMFLDTAVLRPSIASHAKALGYVPSSKRAAKAILNVDVAAEIPSDTTYLSRGTEFTGTDASGTQYKFVLLDTVYANIETNSFEQIPVYEGTLRRISYVYNPTRTSSSVLVIPNDKIDTSTLKVRVKTSATDSSGISDVWSYAESYIDLTSESKVYFLQEKEAGMYELFFGDGFLGKQPESGNIIVIEYLETNADEANGIRSFTSSVAGLGTITVVEPSYGGALHENAAKIKFMAPRYYQTQSRAVTEDDYQSLVLKNYPNVDSVYVYGGESVTPPQYGKVFISIKPKSGSVLSTEVKKSIELDFKRKRSVVTITPEIVDPDYIDLVFSSLVTFNPTQTSFDSGTVKALVASYIMGYSITNLENYGSNLYLSVLVQGINNVDRSILGNETTVRMRKLINLDRLVSSKGFSINFKNPIHNSSQGCGGSVTSRNITHFDILGNLQSNCYVEDNGLGMLNVVFVSDEGIKKIVYPNVGTVDYERGIVNFSSKFAPVYLNPFFNITVVPQNHDLFVSENKILRINRGYPDSLNISLQTQQSRVQNIRK